MRLLLVLCFTDRKKLKLAIYFFIFTFMSACSTSTPYRMVHMEYPDEAPSEIESENTVDNGDIKNSSLKADNFNVNSAVGEVETAEAENDTWDDEENLTVTEMEVLEAEEGGEDGYVIKEGFIPEAPEPVNFGGDGKITIFRYGTKEKITVRYRDAGGKYIQDSLEKINHIMRCYKDDSTTDMAVKLIELLDSVEDHFKKRGIVLLSGYRTKDYNSQIKGAAENSMHLLGWAADIRIPGYSSTKIKNFARQKKAGGVGYYAYTGFVHLDVGKVRYWAQRRPFKAKKIRKKASVKKKVSPRKTKVRAKTKK